MLYFLFIVLTLIFSTLGICPNGGVSSFSNDGCLFFYSNPTAYWVAEKLCRDLNGHLISIHNLADNMFISQQAAVAFNKAEFWFGANDVNSPTKWEWLDSTAFNFTNWDANEPSNVDVHDCGAIKSVGGKWKSDDCYALKPYVCEVKASSLVTTTTTTKTPSATTLPTVPPLPCVDTFDNCQSYLPYCTNPNYQQLMYQKCRKTCNLCNACFDADEHCPQWVLNGFCTNTFYQTKWNECRKSCHFCT